MKTNLHENDLSGIILDAAILVHRELGPGLLESVYEEALCFELNQERGLNISRQIGIPARFKEIKLDLGFRADIIVENKIIIELKSVETILDVHKKQLLTYLKLSNLKLGLLINFNVSLLKEGLTRIVNKL